jgi:PQQ system protein
MKLTSLPGGRDRKSVQGLVSGLVSNYLGLLRPSVLKQLNPRLVALLNELPALDRQNKATLGRLFVHGGLGYAEEGPDGRLHAEVRIPPREFIWQPSIIVMPHGGDLDLDLVNDDPWDPHCALLPSNGDKQWIWLPMLSRGRATLNLDGPGFYWFSSPIGNNEGRGLLGGILVLGDVPPEARLDRPPQPRP